MNRIVSLAVASLAPLVYLTPSGAEEAVRPPRGSDYYVSPSGKDANSGNSPSAAWQSIERVNAQRFLPGDRVCFEGGQTFKGAITLDAEDVGVLCAPVVVTSYGQGRATIESGSANGLKATGCQFLEVENLVFAGGGRDAGDNCGVLFDGVQHSAINQVEVRAYQRAGVEVRNSQHVRVTHVYATENGYVGIGCRGKSAGVYVGYCRAINNSGFRASPDHSGNGILFEWGPQDCLVEFCEAALNGWDMGNKQGANGPCGIWTWDVDNVNIQYCISHDNKTTKGDGNGFDLDGMTRNSLIQYCYSYDNQGCGYLVMPFQRDKGPSNNTIRYCVSENDGEGGIRFYGSDLNTISVYNNVIYNDKMAPIRSAMFGNNAQRVTIRNNIILTKGNHGFIDEDDYAKGRVASVQFAGNCYYNYGGAPKWLNHGSLEEWHKAGMEMVDGKPVGMYADPLLKDAGRGEKLTHPTKLPEMLAYTLRPESPCIDVGGAPFAPAGFAVLKHDLFGNRLPQGSGCDLGVFEAPAVRIRTMLEIVTPFPATTTLSKGVVRCTVTNAAGSRPVAGTVSLAAMQNNQPVALDQNFSLRFENGESLSFSLPPGQQASKDFIIELSPGVCTLQARSSYDGMEAGRVPVTIECPIGRVARINRVEDVAQSLSSQPVHQVRFADKAECKAQWAVAGSDLAVAVQVPDRRVQRGNGPTEWSEVEVYGAARGGSSTGQTFLLPASGEQPAATMLFREGKVVPCPEIRVKSSPMPDGYALEALIPLKVLTIDPPANAFLLQLGIRRSMGEHNALEWMTLFPTARGGSAEFGRMIVRE